MALDPTLLTAVQQQTVRGFVALRIELPAIPDAPAHTIRLIDGSGVVTFNAETFTGEDPVFGTWQTVSSITEEVSQSAPALTVTLLPSQDGSTGLIMSPLYQGAPVRMWVGAINEIDGSVIGAPELLWAGVLDVGVINTDHGVRTVELQMSSVFERMMQGREGIRLSDAWHQSIWPNERGLALMTSSTDRPVWGKDAPARNTTGVSGGGATWSGNPWDLVRR
ncbi:hypothetical protein ACFODL_15570 [Phenylobacterium terrae]|uniref:DUF2163 domain-containing protein n=1 Tax=Phenylobacterium terrae TaxID=2665495 RepID=A0ABW4N907_9CAUL